MQKNFNIPDELKGVAPLLSTLGSQNTYTVPAGYFDSLSDEIMSAIKVYQLPAKKNIYSVPLGYFDSLSDEIMSAIKVYQLPARKNIYSVSPGYFDSFAANILSKIKLEAGHAEEVWIELQETAPLLNTISRKNIYTVPDNYFDGTTIHSHVALAKPGKIVSVKNQFRTFLHYAVAASVLFVIAISSFIYVSMHTRHSNKSLSIEQRLATLNEDDIANYLKYDHQTDDFSPASTLQDNQVKDLLMNASDEEIEYFLDENTDTDEKTVNGI